MRVERIKKEGTWGIQDGERLQVIKGERLKTASNKGLKTENCEQERLKELTIASKKGREKQERAGYERVQARKGKRSKAFKQERARY